MEAALDAGCPRPVDAAVRLRTRLRKRKSPAAVTVFTSSAERGGDPEGRRMFVFGMGFVGRYVSSRLREEGWEVSGTCTSEAKKKELEEMGFDAFIFDASENKLKHLSALQHATHLLISIPSLPSLGDPLIFLQEDLRSTLSKMNLQWLGYLSSTSVYGDCGGSWVNEEYVAYATTTLGEISLWKFYHSFTLENSSSFQANPVNRMAKARLTAEEGWLDLGHDLGTSTYVFRLGGIYGPGRSALDTIISHEALSKYQKMRESRKYIARVHVADIYQAIKASFTLPSTGRVYNVVDDDPAPRAEVFAFARDLIEQKWPGKIKRSAPQGAADQEMGADDTKREKRVSNARLKEELGVRLIHPSYRSGLQSILDSWESPFQ